MKRFNFIFTGKYLKFWYIAFFAIIFVMLFNWRRDMAVTQYQFIVFSSSGEVVSTQIVDRSYANMIINETPLTTTPITKQFIPIK